MNVSYVSRYQQGVAYLTLLIALFGAFFIAMPASAQSSCGDFIERWIDDDESLQEFRDPIQNCDNPFLLNDVPAITNVQVFSNDEPFVSGGIIDVDSFPAFISFEITSEYVGEIESGGAANSGSFWISALYKHEDDDFLIVETSSFPTISIQESGTYTVVIDISGPIFLSSLFQSIFDFIVPTAYAYSLQPFPAGGLERVAVTFTVQEVEPEPTGASSVLFLPGIMGSRLYEESDVCGGSFEEQQRWFSIDDCEQLRLLTRFDGTSIHDIYTRAEDEAVIDTIAGFPLYDDWLETLAKWKDLNIIADYKAVPYDWRLSLEDVFKTREVDDKIIFDIGSDIKDSYIYKSLQQLVKSSESGKVTIIAHSNGGLVTKALILALQQQDDELLDAIDNVVLVGVPQTGTPDAITSILHGSQLGFGLIADRKTSRALTNTAPFAHHLLPSLEYQIGDGAAVSSPFIEFLPGSETDAWREKYGDTISNVEELHSFLSTESGRIDPAIEDVLRPEVVDPFLLNYAKTIHTKLANFVPEPEMDVYQIAGTGAVTIESVTYFTDRACVQRSALSFFTCTEYEDKLGYRINHTQYGDGTVVLPSAVSMTEKENVERIFINLKEYNARNLFNRVHRNILEISYLQELLADIISNEDYIENQYISLESTSFDDEDRLVFQLLSPLDMVLESEDGEVSSTTNSLPNGVYGEVGELKYISIPFDTKDPQLTLSGYADGSFTLIIEKLNENSTSQRVVFSGIPSTNGTVVSLNLLQNIASSTLALDLEGDGIIEAVASIETVESVLESEGLKETSNSTGTRVDRGPLPQVAGVSISTEDQVRLEQLKTIYNLLGRIYELLKIRYE